MRESEDRQDKASHHIPFTAIILVVEMLEHAAIVSYAKPLPMCATSFSLTSIAWITTRSPTLISVFWIGCLARTKVVIFASKPTSTVFPAVVLTVTDVS